MYGVNNDEPIDMSGPEVTQMLSRPTFGIVSGFRESAYDTVDVTQHLYNETNGDPISQNNIDRAYNEIQKVLNATVWNHKKLLNYRFTQINSSTDSFWLYLKDPNGRNLDNVSKSTFYSAGGPGNLVVIALDGSLRIKNSKSLYNINNTNGQMQEEIFDSFCNTNVDGPDYLIALNLPGAPSTDLGKTLMGIAYVMRPGTSYWNQ
jgi:hypothetical protein